MMNESTQTRILNLLDVVAGQVNGLTMNFNTFSTKFDGLSKRVDELTMRVDVLTTRVDDLTMRVDVLTTRVDGLAVELVELRNETRAGFERIDRRFGRLKRG